MAPLVNITPDESPVDDECCKNGKCIPGCSIMGGRYGIDFFVCKYDGERDRSIRVIKENVFCFIKLWECQTTPFVWEKTRGRPCYQDSLFFTNHQRPYSYKMNIYTFGKNHEHQTLIRDALNANISPNKIREFQEYKYIKSLKMLAHGKKIKLPHDITRYTSSFLTSAPQRYFIGSRYIRSYKKNNYKSKDSRKNSISSKNRKGRLIRRTNKIIYNNTH